MKVSLLKMNFWYPKSFVIKNKLLESKLKFITENKLLESKSKFYLSLPQLSFVYEN